MRPFNAAAAAAFAAPFSGNATINAVLGIFSGSGKLSAVHRLVARNAKRYAVVNVEHQFGMFRNRLDMMRVQCSRLLTAMLARVTIPRIHRLAPYSQVAFGLCSSTVKADATLPCRGVGASQHLATTRSGAESRTLISAIERDAAMQTVTRLRGVASGPAFLRAIVGSVGAVRLYLKRGSAFLAIEGNLCVFHGSIIPRNAQLSPSYVAIALMGLTPEREAADG